MQEAAERGEYFDDKSSNYSLSHISVGSATPSPDKDDRHQNFGQAFQSLKIHQTQSVDLKAGEKLDIKQEINKPVAETVKIEPKKPALIK